VFAENWLECCGEILTSPRHWPPLEPCGPPTRCWSRARRPIAPRSRGRLSDADRRGACVIDISTPYFLPDRVAAQGTGAARQRGVRVRVIVPGRSPISGSCGSRAGGCSASCSRPASASTNTARR
jgi:cardiolipin synthase